jgi:hypothetical protein
MDSHLELNPIAVNLVCLPGLKELRIRLLLKSYPELKTGPLIKTECLCEQPLAS